VLEHHGLDRRAQILGWLHDSEPNRPVIQRPEGRDPQRHLVRGEKRFQIELGFELGLSFLQERPPGQPERDRRDDVGVPVQLPGPNQRGWE
jgi:hypothetical protein